MGPNPGTVECFPDRTTRTSFHPNRRILNRDTGHLEEARLALHFGGRELVIATAHGKEQVLGPILEDALGVRTTVPANFDSDAFGTFTGEKTRPGDMLETARAKCLAALAATGGDLAVASEGSFGPHPQLPWAAADTEVLLLVDLHNRLEIHALFVTTRTNFQSEVVHSLEALDSFANRVGFPNSGLIVRPPDEAWESVSNDHQEVEKGIHDTVTLYRAFHRVSEQWGAATVEPDMRAMCNPLRMEAIAEVGQRLVQKLKVICPGCAAPGFDVHQVVRGLPCRACSGPTPGVASLIYRCYQCRFQLEVKHPDGKTHEDPGFCDRCNP